MDWTLDIERFDDYLIDACVNNERWAQKEIYESFYTQMLTICMRYANNKADAQDILHDGFIKVFRNITKFKKGSSLSAWIRRLMINTAIDYYRKNARKRTEPITEAFHLNAKEADAISKVSEKEILRTIQMLSPSYRIVFNLYVIEGYSHQEIGKILGIKESTSRSNLVKARSKLKELILKNTNYGS